MSNPHCFLSGTINLFMAAIYIVSDDASRGGSHIVRSSVKSNKRMKRSSREFFVALDGMKLGSKIQVPSRQKMHFELQASHSGSAASHGKHQKQNDITIAPLTL